ncbi:RNA-binding protein [Marinilactibacillus sp. Marseille-P9653]|uniref:YlmH family RNA-binding protein n=1 Tax=Marinilactibacillus sp. Marseille-P9653 TaxID=2866583 RepID=UPI001CE41D49|nr:RNA-binding protein [Marinilactibacillus sp. Marseille-P9653]
MDNVYQHFRKDEQNFIDTVMDWTNQVEEQYTPYLTPFLDPRQQYIVESVVGQSTEISLHYFGGYEDAERKRLFLSPPYFEPEQQDYNITICEINYPTKFATLSHGSILGTLTGAGINRETLGDIITDGETWQFFMDQPMLPYLLSQIESIGKIKVHLEEKSYTEIILPRDKWDSHSVIASSLRIDVVLAAAFNLSRQKSKELISSNKVKVNWNEISRPDISLGISDVISIRGFGRIKLKSIEGKTRKEKIRLELDILDRNQ